jgi:hypothetical protein
MGKSEWDGYDYKPNYDSSISYDEPSSYSSSYFPGNTESDEFPGIFNPFETKLFDVGTEFQIDIFQQMMNMRNLLEQLRTAHYNDYQNVFENNDQEQEYAEEVKYDPSNRMITHFTLMRPNENRKIYFTWSSPNLNFDEQVDEDVSYPRLQGDFIDTEDEFPEKEQSKWADNSKEILVDGDRVMIINSNNDDIYDLFNGDYENDRIADQPDFLFYHFPIHYILICFGFTLLFTMLFVLRRRQMILARARARRQAIEENIASNRSTFVVIPKPKDCVEIEGQNDKPPTYTEAVQVQDESDTMLPKYKDIQKDDE